FLIFCLQFLLYIFSFNLSLLPHNTYLYFLLFTQKYTCFSAFWQLYFRHFGSYFFGHLALLYFFHQYTASIAETEPASFHFNFFNTSPMSPSIQTERSAISFGAAASP